MTPPWSLARGATLLSPHETRFSVWAPTAKRVTLRVEGDAGASSHELTRTANGVFERTVMHVGAGALYSYRLGDDDTDYPDPVSRSQPRGVHGPSCVVDPRAFAWQDVSWRGVEMADLVIYELHVGTFTDAGTFAGVVDHLAELRELGVSAIELMPVAEFPGARNWGYDGVHPYAPHHAYGGPDGLRRLVDAAHRAQLAVVLDVVYNHLGPEGNYLGAFGPYVSERYRTPWGHPMNFDGPGSDEVRRYFIDNALYWITEYHIDALRLDAVHAIFDFGARHVLAELTEAVHAQGNALGRRTLVIGESDLNDPKLVRDSARGGYALDAQWSDDFHHAMHAVLTGESTGYYEDFGGVSMIAKALHERFVYDGRYSAHRHRRHGAPAVDVSADHFVIAMQNHDQVGNRAVGDRLATTLSFEKLKLATAALLASPYVPLIFMGDEYAERHPFLYFVSHEDASLNDAVRRGRREEFASFGWRADDIPDPVDEETFRRSKLDRSAATRPEGVAMRALHSALLRLRAEEGALHPGDANVEVAYGEDASPATGWISLRLTPIGTGDSLLVLINLGDVPRTIPLARGHGAWRLLLATDDRAYGGRDTTRLAGDGTLAPWTVALYRGGLA